MDTQIINTGADDEDDASLHISNDDLGINTLVDSLKLDAGTTDNQYPKVFTESISDNALSGVYPIKIEAKYSGKESDTKTVDLTVNDCEKTKRVKEQVKEEKPKVEVIKPIIAAQQKPNAPIVRKKTFADTEEYTVIVSIMLVLLLGTAVFVVGGAFIVLRK